MTNTELFSYLDSYTLAALLQMAAFLGIPLEKKRSKNDIIEKIIKQLKNPDSIQARVEGLATSERAALDAILRRDGRATVRAVRQEMDKLGLIDPNAQVGFGEYDRKNRPEPQAKNSRRLEDLLARLMLFGLVFAEPRPSPYGYGYQNKRTFYDAYGDLYILDFILPWLPEPAPLKEQSYTIDVQTVQESSARVFQRDLYLYWGYLRDHVVTLTQRNEISKAALKEISAILQVRETPGKGQNETDLPRTRFLRGALEALNLARQRAGRMEVEERAAEAFFALSPADRVQRTYEAWVETERYNELLMLPVEIRPKSTNNPLVPAKKPLIKARAYILEQFNRLARKDGAQNWVALKKLVDNINENNYEFLFKRFITPSSYYSTYTYTTNPYDYSSNEMMLTFPGIYKENEGWDLVEAVMIRSLVTGPLYWMGLVDIGVDGSGAPTAFRLTAMGAWLFGLAPKPEVQVEGGRVIVQPNMQVMALDPIQDVVLATLDRFAERLSAERAVEYRLTRASVYAAQQSGWSAQRIQETLRQYSGAELPGNVARTLEEWQQQFERITIHPHVTIAHGAPEVIDRLSAVGNTADCLKARPLPEVALLTGPQAVPVVMKALRRQGILPVANSLATVPPASVIADEKGMLRFTTQTPSLYLHGHLVAFADPVERGYQITAQSVQRATRSGMTAVEILQRLESVHSGPLPEKLVRSIRTWAKHYGSAGLSQVTLLQVRDEATLAELLADPEVGPLLHRFTPKKTRALARVRAEHVEKLKALLAERGVDLADHLE